MKVYEGLMYMFLRAARGVRGHAEAARFDPSAVRSILVVSSTAIGDTLLSTPAIRAVRKRYPQARIVALLNRDNMTLFDNNPNIDAVVPYRGGWKGFFRTVRELRKYGFDLALIFHGNEPQATPMCYLSGAPFIFKLPNRSRFGFLLSNSAPAVDWEDLGHGIHARLRTAALAGCPPDGPEMDLVLKREALEEAGRFLEAEGVLDSEVLVGLQPGASTLSRQWFAERFIELGRLVGRELPATRIVLTGSPAETGLTSGIAAGIGGGAVSAAGRLTLPAMAALISKLSVLVTGDTGPMHIAYALRTPVVALYAVSDPARTGPLYDRNLHRIIKKGRTCEPCVSKRCEYQKCMENIEVGEVFSAVKDALRAKVLQ